MIDPSIVLAALILFLCIAGVSAVFGYFLYTVIETLSSFLKRK